MNDVMVSLNRSALRSFRYWDLRSRRMVFGVNQVDEELFGDRVYMFDTGYRLSDGTPVYTGDVLQRYDSGQMFLVLPSVGKFDLDFFCLTGRVWRFSDRQVLTEVFVRGAIKLGDYFSDYRLQRIILAAYSEK